MMAQATICILMGDTIDLELEIFFMYSAVSKFSALMHMIHSDIRMADGRPEVRMSVNSFHRMALG